MTTPLWIAVITGLVVLVAIGGGVAVSRRRLARQRQQAEALNLARRALDDVEFNRRELVRPSETIRLALRLQTFESLLTSPEFAEIAGLETLRALQEYYSYLKAVGETAMVQRTEWGEPLVMSHLLAEAGGREKFERLSRGVEDALQQVFERDS